MANMRRVVGLHTPDRRNENQSSDAKWIIVRFADEFVRLSIFVTVPFSLKILVQFRRILFLVQFSFSVDII